MANSIPTENLISYSDDELLEHISRSSTLSAVAPRVRAISLSLVAKEVPEDEADDELAALALARRLQIRAPIVRRVVKGDPVYIIMDRIHGSTLADRWPTLSWISTILLALQLRQYVQQLRSLTSRTVGSLSSGKCRSIWVSDYYGIPDHATSSELDAFLGFWTCYRANSSRNSTLPLTRRLVLCHHDLAPRNIIIDETGNVWLLDWQLSGWYPDYFEYASMQNFESHKWNRWSRFRWWIFSWISTGNYECERKLLASIRHKCGRFPLARKSLVLTRKSK